MKHIQTSSGVSFMVDDEDFREMSAIRWRLDRYGYVRSRRGGVEIYAHRLIAGAGPLQIVDHANGNKLDNRRSNLRVCTQSESMCNRGKVLRPASSKYKGVYRMKRRNAWRVRVKKEGRVVYEGVFDDEKYAAEVYNRAAMLYHGDFARLNVIE